MMEAMAPEWTEGRLDEMSQKVDSGFERLDTDIRELRVEVATVQRTMVQGFIALTAAMLAGFGGLAALIASQV
jgi:hypothetical protein